MSSYTPQQFVETWRSTPLSERASYQLHFNDICRLVGHEPPTGRGVDERGLQFVFERALKKDSGTPGFADVYYENHFAVEYKAPGKYKDLGEAYQQLLQYREKLNNPPLLVVTDIEAWEIHTNWPNTEKKIYRFSHDDIARRPSVLQMLRDLFDAPERLHPNRNTEQVTADAAQVFETIASNMRDWRAEPDRIAHFLTKLVFCLFAEDVGLLPAVPGSARGIFSEIIAQTRTDSERFKRYTADLFKAMADGGELLFQKIPYFNGSLFDDVTVEDVKFEALLALEKASRLNWQSVEPAIFGTLFERSLDPAKRSQLGAHYTSREDILLIVEPVLMQPLRREWARIQAEAAPIREKYDEALRGSSQRLITTYGNQLKALQQQMLTRLRETTVLDPACGSGNFLYVCLQLLMDMEKEVINSDLFLGMTQALPEVHPDQMYGIEKDEIAHALASIVVWIGYLQWHQNNGYTRYSQPILKDLSQNIVCRDAILEFPSDPTPSPSPSQDPTPSPSPMRWGGEQGEGYEGWAHTHTDRALYDKIKLAAREMRKEPTPAEDVLWQRLRGMQLQGYRFRRQHPIDRFIVDFFCAPARLVIEVDGPVHETQQEYDAARQAYLESLGLRVLRFTNDAVFGDLEAVLGAIEAAVMSPQPHPQPLPNALGRGEGEGYSEPEWPAVDVIVSNPPFLGGSRLRGELGDAYYESLTKLYEGRVPGFADLVCYWFEKARAQIEQGKAKRAGLLATNSIRGGANREVLKRIKESGDIFMAWADRAWVLEGAAVRVSMVGFDDGSEQKKTLDNLPVESVNADLTASVDITKAEHLKENEGISFQGPSPKGNFDISAKLAQEMLASKNPSGRHNADVVKRVINAADIVRNSREYWTIDFGPHTSEDEAALYISPYEHVKKYVYPFRQENNRQSYKEKWWIYAEARVGMRLALDKVARYIATPRVAKHRIFVWVDNAVMSNDAIIVFAREDDYFFGVLHSRLHEVWSLRMGTWLGKGNDPRYTPTTTFETFPFPWPPGQEDESSAAYQAISAAAKQLDAERSAWLNPHQPHLLPTQDPNPSPTQDPTPSPTHWGGEQGEGRKYRDRTLTNLYNALNGWRGTERIRVTAEAADFAPRLDALHQALDRAVCEAYGWSDMGGEGYAVNLYTPEGEEEILRRLLALNLARAGRAGG